VQQKWSEGDGLGGPKGANTYFIRVRLIYKSMQSVMNIQQYFNDKRLKFRSVNNEANKDNTYILHRYVPGLCRISIDRMAFQVGYSIQGLFLEHDIQDSPYKYY